MMSNTVFALTCAAALTIQGCAGVPVQTIWQEAPAHAPLRPFHIVLSQDDLTHACGNAPALKYYGCAVRVQDDRVCIIYTAAKPAGWVMDHEHRHCAGWDHDDVVPAA